MLKVISHRGNGIHKYKENTLDAIKASLNEDYVDGVEFDVRITKNKKIIVYHDPIIISHSKIAIIKDSYFDEIKALVPSINTLNEILDNINTYKKIVIELKEETKQYQELADNVYSIIRKYQYLNIYICSFNYDLINYFKNKYPNIKCGLLISIFLNTDKINNNFDFNSYIIIHLDEIKFNKEVMIWGVKTKRQEDRIKMIAKIYNKYDIDVITDKPINFKDN